MLFWISLVGCLVIALLVITVVCLALEVRTYNGMVEQGLSSIKKLQNLADTRSERVRGLEADVRIKDARIRDLNRVVENEKRSAMSSRADVREYVDVVREQRTQLAKNKAELEESAKNWKTYIDRYTDLAKASAALQEALENMYADNILPRITDEEDDLEDGGY